MKAPNRVAGQGVMSSSVSSSSDEIERVRARLENSQRIAGIGDWETDLLHRHLHWSDEIYRILDIPAGGGPPDSDQFYRKIHPDDLEMVHKKKLSVESGSHAVQFEHRIIRGDGEVRYIQQRAQMVFDAQGRPLRIIGTIQDITDRKAIEDQSFRGQRLEMIGSIASGIVHDLNNVLGPVQMATELLLAETTDPKTIQLLEMMSASSQRGADMVKQILTFAKGTNNERSVVRLDLLLKDMANVVRHTFSETIRFSITIEPDCRTLIGDPVQIHQVLLNLCANARDAMPKGGTLTVSIGNVSVDPTFAQMSSPDASPGSYVLLSVKDSGMGMPPEVRAHIFDMFYTTKADHKGTGLGLSTVQRIVKSHGGFILVQSQPGTGSEFKVYLPAGDAPSDRSPPAEKPFVGRGSGELILVVDDEAAIRSVIQQTLELSGYEVVTASDGAQAVARCVEHSTRLKLMITDMSMPIMGGVEAIQAVLAIAPHVRIIAATGTDSKSRAASASLAKTDAFLYKPYSADELLKTVDAVLKSRTLR